jgi:hypothetical protein
MESSAPQFTPVEQPKKSNTGMIIGIVVAVLLCCCCLVIVSVFLFMGPAVNNVYSSINEQLTAMPGVPSLPEGTLEPSMPSVPSSMVPQGGLGDDLLRTNTWGYVVTVAAIDGCAGPNAAETEITVTQEQDSDGVWKEQWVVACDGGKSVPVDVVFTPNATTGGTDIKVTLAK